jgi:hypothetical protein
MFKFSDFVRDVKRYKEGRMTFSTLLAKYKNVQPRVFDLASKWVLSNG